MINIFWMRRDLRLNDNKGLWEALKNGLPVRIIFIFDTQILQNLNNPNDRRVSFIYNRILELNRQLKPFESEIHCFYGSVKNVFERLTKETNINAVFANRDYEPYGIKRDKEIDEYLRQRGIQFTDFKDHLIFETTDIVKENREPYGIYTPYSKKWKQHYYSRPHECWNSEQLLSRLDKTQAADIPKLETMGFNFIEGIGTELDLNMDIIANYDKTRNTPSIAGTSRLGPHLRFGTVSIRELAKKASTINETYLNELIWREFFSQVLFHYPHVVDGAYKKKYDAVLWRNNEEELLLWQEGKTGFPLVDAGIRELVETGFMHNRVRMVVASFLVKDLLIDWRIGEAWFARHLMDYELASNNGNWQWAAGTGCDAAPYFRIFNPVAQQKKFDPTWAYIKIWVPEFGTSKYPNEMVDHKMARQRALETYKEALH